MFKKIGKFFSRVGRAIGNFFGNLFKDPLMTVMLIVSTIVSFGALAPLMPAIAGYMAGMMGFGAMGTAIVGGATIIMENVLAMALLGAFVAVVALGSDSRSLIAALAVVNFIAGVVTTLGGSAVLSGMNALGIVPTSLYAITQTTYFMVAAVAISAYLTYSTLIAVNEDIMLSSAFVEAAEEIGGVIGGVVGGATGGILDGLLSSGVMGWALVIGGAYVGYKLLSSSGDDTNINLTPQLFANERVS